ncbi:hypothetical protein FCG67_14120 [Rhodococcus oryzae]|uniref:Uncharacterized protein n=1 Tax=Rhodococcus oryzae TaxID=2571143 RepID=A0ABY2RIE5_9NOCA|nr:DUF6508 domain-containing protein [Rhodococcus oryzae]TJZ76993.1 hypothetical protein FCG67_14120 [Rhodococcus oryzae]
MLAALTSEDWAQLRSLVDRMNAHSGSFGGWVAPEPIDENSFSMGYSTMGPLLEESFNFIYDRKLILLGFAWMDWHAGDLLVNGETPPEWSALSLEVTLGMITAITRSDRFCEGALLKAFDDGTMPKLFARLLDFAPSDGTSGTTARSCT